MKLVFDKDILTEALESTCSILTSKNLFTVLNNVLVSVKDKKCVITSTDLTDTMLLKCAIISGDDCEFLLNGKTILPILKTLPKGEVCLDLNDSLNQICVISGKFKANISLEDKKDFPNINSFENLSTGLKFNVNDLKNSISFVTPFASTDTTREIFCGVHFEYNFKENKEAFITLCATDGHRLAKTDLIAKDIQAENPEKNGYCLSTKSFQIFSKFFSSDQDVLISFKEKTKAVLKNDTITLITSLITGDFPDFSCVIPKTKNHIIVNKNDMINSLKRCSLFNPKMLSAEIKASENNLNLKCLSSDIGSMSEDIECKYTGSEITLCVNAKYLEQSLSSVDDTFAVIGIEDEQTPIKIISETDYDSKDDGTLSIVMPMQV